MDDDEFDNVKAPGKKEVHLFGKGNQFWKNRLVDGPPPKFDNPQQLLDLAGAYFEWAQDNPIYEAKAFSSGITIRVPHQRAFTVQGFLIHANIARRTWRDYEGVKGDAFAQACITINDIIREQKFVGAAAGMLNPAIIARDLGLADKTETKNDVTVQIIDTHNAKHEGDD